VGTLIVTALVAAAVNALLLPLAAYGCIKLGLLPGVDWPVFRRRPAPQSPSTTPDPQSASQSGRIHVRVVDGGQPVLFASGQQYTVANTQAEATYVIAS
jgi:hypothetical protein